MSGKFALIIGNTEYTDPALAQLTAPGKDAEDFARVLEDQDICAFDDVRVLLNEPEYIVRGTIDEFFDQKKPDDLLVLYFSGHGVRDELGALYLAVKNTIRTRLRSTAIKSDYIREAMDQSRSKRQVLILDCCNSGAFTQGTKAELGGTMGMVSALQGRGRFILTASDATQFAWEGDQVIGETQNSLFTHFLVKGLEGEADNDGDGKITVDELYDYAHDQISALTPKQTPTKSVSIQEGEIILRQFTRMEDIKPVALPNELTEATEDSRTFVREGAVQELEKLLRGKNLGLARSAREVLERIEKEDDSIRVRQAAARGLETIRQAEQKAEEERLATKKAEAEQKVGEEAEQLLAKQKAEEAQKAKIQAEHLAEEKRRAAAEVEKQQKAKQDAERLAKQKAEEERLAREKVEAERKAEAEAARLAKKKAEEERTEKAKNEAEQLVAQKSKQELLASKKNEAARKAKEEAAIGGPAQAERDATQQPSTEKVTPQKARPEVTKIGSSLEDRASLKSNREAKESIRGQGTYKVTLSTLTSPTGIGISLVLLSLFIWGAISLTKSLMNYQAITPTVATQTQVPIQGTLAIPTSPMFALSSEITAEWQTSGHADISSEAFRHWDSDSPAEIPTVCAKCHSTAGFLDFWGADGGEAGTVNQAVAVSSTPIICEACHSGFFESYNEIEITFPSGISIKAQKVDGLCMTCHQGRESKTSVDVLIAQFGENLDPDAVPAGTKDDQGNDVKLGFRNIHYFAAAATLYGTQVKGGYEYDGVLYDAKNMHVDGYDTCTGCHDPHTLKVKVEQCALCHENINTVEDLKNIRQPQASAWDYDADGNKEEGIYYEIQGLQEALLAQIQKYARETAGAEIKYNTITYPYFMGADDQAYPNWTPRLLKAAYNYQVSVKDPGAFAHGNKYIVQLLYDSIQDLGGDVSKFAREDAGHFAGDTIAFRDWDAEGEVPGACAKCHSATGLPEFIKNGGTIVVSSNGSTQTTGVVAKEPSNGFKCSTCHDEANWPNRYQIASVVFPSGRTVSLGGKDADGIFVADDSNLCIECHQGRESTASVNAVLRGKDADIVDPKISFKNIHYFAAGATLFGNDVQGAYQYEGKDYVGQNVTHPLNKCKDCHDAHALEPKFEACAGCHGTAKPTDIRFGSDTTDWDGDGNVTEGIAGEIETLSEALYTEIQIYANSQVRAGIVYDLYAYPYFFLDEDGNGEPDKNDQGQSINYNGNWTPRLLKAVFNYQYVQKDPGVFVHNPKYVIQFLIDSIEDLGGDVSKYIRPSP